MTVLVAREVKTRRKCGVAHVKAWGSGRVVLVSTTSLGLVSTTGVRDRLECDLSSETADGRGGSDGADSMGSCPSELTAGRCWASSGRGTAVQSTGSVGATAVPSPHG